LNSYWVGAQHIGLDFDNGDSSSSLDYLLSVPFIAQHAAFAYTMLSHTPVSPTACASYLVSNMAFGPDGHPIYLADVYSNAAR
jgi:hypothetical protein